MNDSVECVAFHAKDVDTFVRMELDSFDEKMSLLDELVS